MALPNPAQATFQEIRDKDKNNFQNVWVNRFGAEPYVYWNDTQRTSGDVDHLQIFLSKNDDALKRGVRVLFEVEAQVRL